MDSACGRRGSVVNAMSSHLFLLDFLKVRFCLPCKQRLHLRRRVTLQKVATSRTPAHTAKM